MDGTINFTNETAEKKLLMNYSPELTAVFITAYLTVFIIGVVGNILVIVVITVFPKMRTVTNIFILNLAFADLLVIIFCLPATLLANIFVQWILGWHLCKLVSYFQGVSVSASVYTLVAIAAEKFHTICFPMKMKVTSKGAMKIILIIWIYSLIITSPWLLVFELMPANNATLDIFICVDSWPMEDAGNYYFLIVNFGLTYFVPLCVITACYSAMFVKLARRNIPGQSDDMALRSKMEKSKHKIEKMLIVVVLLFMISWLPLYIVFSIIKLEEPALGSFKQNILNILVPIAQWMGTSNSCINPVIYAYNKKFRDRLLILLKCKCARRTLREGNR